MDRPSSTFHRQDLRPMPQAFFRGEFVLCDRGRRCKGESCTFPHSVEERDAWNAEKFGRPIGTTQPVKFEGITSQEWPSLPPSKSVKKTSSGLPPSAWSQQIQEKWQQQQQQQSSTAHRKSSAPPLARVKSAGGLPTHTLKELQFHQAHVQRERYSSDPSDSTPLLNRKQLERHPDPQTEFQQIQPSNFISPALSHHMSESVSHKTTVQQPPQVEAEDPLLHLSLAALLSKKCILENKSNLFQATLGEDMLAEINNMVPLQHPEQSQQPQHTGLSPLPDCSELGIKSFPSPIQTPLAAQVPTLSTQAVSTPPPLQLPLQARGLSQSTQQHLTHHHGYAAMATEFLERVKEDLYIEDIQVKLSRQNYKEKMHKLLCWEEKTHVEILCEKCNGQYTLVLYQAGLKPSWMTKDERPMHVRFGYLLDLNGDQIAYATQASEGAFIMHEGEEVKMHILRENYSHTNERMYIAFDKSNLSKLEKLKTLSVSREFYTSPMKIEVEFELKHFYFNSLHDAIKLLPSEIIARIMPEAQEFKAISWSQLPDMQQFKNYCSKDQLNALKAIATCSSNGPPILIDGAFGTGKTRILAVAAHYLFQESQKSKQPVRVLVCTQMRVSADTFLECYLFKLIDLLRLQQEPGRVYLIRAAHGRISKLEQYYRTVSWFKTHIERSSYKEHNYLIIAPCLTALQLAKFIPNGFFTHILLDEGAQTREPEAVAPLSMAGRDTKIVIAGDQNQVGPAMLVLGDEAQENGLAVSLLERLHTLYGKLGKVTRDHCATLVTNYRCHQGILELAEKLFYKSLSCNVPSSAAHSAAPYPLLFFCSSIDDKVQSVDSTMNEQEAEITLRLVAKFAKGWPMWEMCLMSTTRTQLTAANQLIQKLNLSLNGLRKHPTYDVQGHEFRALFLSTSEPTDEDGATRNPTKSICDRYVFNTAITRAQSLVVAVGNPFMLLHTEKHMVQKYGPKGKCWSNYLNLCFEHGTLFIHDSLQVTETEKSRCMQKLYQLVEEHLARSSSDIWRAEDAAETSLQQPLISSANIRHLGDGDKRRPTAMARPNQSDPKRQLKQPPHHPPSPPTKPQTDSSSIKDDSFRLEEEYDRIKLLGQGGFGVVYHVKHKTDLQEYAVKIIKLNPDQKATSEAEVLARLIHPNIVRYYTSWKGKAPSRWNDKELWEALKSSGPTSPGEVSPTCLFIQTELCREQTLQQWLEKNIEDRRRKTVFNYFNQMLKAVVYIHKKGLVHLDLKPSNIFFSCEGEDNLKVGDFGLVTGNVASSMTPGSGQSCISMASIRFCMSPEKMAGGVSTPQDQKQKDANTLNQMIDVFCLGVIYFKLCCPFSNDEKRDEVFTKLFNNQEFPQKFTKHLEAKLIKKLLFQEPSDKISAENVQNCELMRRLKRNARNSHAKMLVL